MEKEGAEVGRFQNLGEQRIKPDDLSALKSHSSIEHLLVLSTTQIHLAAVDTDPHRGAGPVSVTDWGGKAPLSPPSTPSHLSRSLQSVELSSTYCTVPYH